MVNKLGRSKSMGKGRINSYGEYSIIFGSDLVWKKDRDDNRSSGRNSNTNYQKSNYKIKGERRVWMDFPENTPYKKRYGNKKRM